MDSSIASICRNNSSVDIRDSPCTYLNQCVHWACGTFSPLALDVWKCCWFSIGCTNKNKMAGPLWLLPTIMSGLFLLLGWATSNHRAHTHTPPRNCYRFKMARHVRSLPIIYAQQILRLPTCIFALVVFAFGCNCSTLETQIIDFLLGRNDMVWIVGPRVFVAPWFRR